MESYVCGIDIGTKNLGICFFSSKEIIAYRGSLNHLIRYQLDTDIIDYKSNSEDMYDSLTDLLDMIHEFQHTTAIKIEKQVPFHNAEVLRIDGIIFGYVKRICKNVQYVDSKRRMSFMKSICVTDPECENVVLPSKSYRPQKIPGMKIVKYFFPEFFEFIAKHVDDGKLDDICDSLIYAIMDTFHAPNAEINIKKIKI